MPPENRIEQTSVASSPPDGPRRLVDRVVRRTVVVVLGAALGASCPFWPARFQPVCEAAVGLWHAIESVTESPPTEAKHDG